MDTQPAFDSLGKDVVRPSQNDRTMALLIHLSSLATPLISLVIWLVTRKQSRFCDQHGRELFSFWFTFFLLAALLLTLLFTSVSFENLGLAGNLILGFLVLLAPISIIFASVRAINGKWFLYPVSIRRIWFHKSDLPTLGE